MGTRAARQARGLDRAIGEVPVADDRIGAAVAETDTPDRYVTDWCIDDASEAGTARSA